MRRTGVLLVQDASTPNGQVRLWEHRGLSEGVARKLAEFRGWRVIDAETTKVRPKPNGSWWSRRSWWQKALLAAGILATPMLVAGAPDVYRSWKTNHYIPNGPRAREALRAGYIQPFINLGRVFRPPPPKVNDSVNSSAFLSIDQSNYRSMTDLE